MRTIEEHRYLMESIDFFKEWMRPGRGNNRTPEEIEAYVTRSNRCKEIEERWGVNPNMQVEVMQAFIEQFRN